MANGSESPSDGIIFSGREASLCAIAKYRLNTKLARHLTKAKIT